MSVTESAEPREQYLAAVDALVKSRVLHGSESLCRLLRYLADQTLQNPGAPIKEYQIATELFGRPSDFDPHVDSAIRVQAGRLRVKLAEYYASEGAEDPILIELPKGTYSLVFHHQPPNAKPAAEEGAAAERVRARHILWNWSAGVVTLSLLLAAAVAALVAMWQSRAHTAVPSREKSATVPVEFQTFWKGFLTGPEEPWVIFSNAAFVGRPETGMRYRNPVKDTGGLILDHYTGVGEVLAVHELDRVFHELNREIRVKRGSLFSLDDAKNNNLIFVGSPAENLTLRDLPVNRQFVFQRLDSGPRNGDLAIVDMHPRPNQPAYFMGSSANAPLSEDYAVIAMVPGLNPPERVLILAGTTTMGTQAAVEFVCRENSLQQLLSQLEVAPGAEVKPFEAVVHVKVTRGVPVESNLVAVRKDSP